MSQADDGGWPYGATGQATLANSPPADGREQEALPSRLALGAAALALFGAGQPPLRRGYRLTGPRRDQGFRPPASHFFTAFCAMPNVRGT